MTTTTEAMDAAKAYMDESRAREHRGGSELTMDDMQPVMDFVRAKFEGDEGFVFHVYESFMDEFTKGHRCSVCGRTRKQNAAIDYDCIHEC